MSLPGLPALLPAAEALFSAISSLASDAITATSNQTVQWGIFLNGEPVVIADNVVSVEFVQDYKISNYPIEQGSFASYNKVQQPFEVKVAFSTGGSSSDKQEFINSIAAVIGDTNLYTLATPDVTYSNLNFVHQDYRRNSGRVGLLVIDVRCEEVRPASLATSTSTPTTTSGGTTTATTTDISIVPGNQINQPQNPAASPVVNGGNLQAQDPSPAQASQFQLATPLP